MAIASAVTAYSRMIINQYKLQALDLGLNIYYSDTDSLVLNGPLPEEIIDSAVLGKLKLEYKFKEGIFIMPKVYYLELEDGTTISKVKGFPGKLTKTQYLELLSGNTLDLQVTKWTRSLKDYQITLSLFRRKFVEHRRMNIRFHQLNEMRDRFISNIDVFTNITSFMKGTV